MKQMSDKDKKIVFYVIQQMKNGDIKFPSGLRNTLLKISKILGF